MSFIDSTYLVGEINIPNKDKNSSIITQAITQYEKEILISLLGYKLYSLLIADLNESLVPVTQKYIDLVNGAEFQHEATFGETITLKWEGLKNTQKESLIANYVFYMMVERETTHLSGIGNTELKTEFAQRVSPMNKMVNAWDKMRTMYGKFPVELKIYIGDKPIYGSNMSGIYNDEPSAFNFLYANKDNYPDWYFKPIWGINQFGI
jgi:hypothetical protein